nr:hypothetical protein [Tanacetum cinerariifolium]
RSIGTRCWDTLVTLCFGISPAKDLVAYVLGKIRYELVSCNINVEQVKLWSNTPPESYFVASHFRGVTDWYQSQGNSEPGPTSTGLHAWPRGARVGTTLTRLHTLCTGAGYPEYIPPEDDVFPAEEQPLPAAATPTTDSPGYIPESDPDEDPEDDDKDPKEDPADYPNDHDDDEEEEEPSGDDADEEDEEQDEEDDDE